MNDSKKIILALASGELANLVANINKELSHRNAREIFRFCKAHGYTAEQVAAFLVADPNSRFFGMTPEAVKRILREAKNE